MEKKRWDNTCKVAKTSSLVKLTFTANADTTVLVCFSKQSYDALKIDDTISLTANQEKTTVYDRESIYKFLFMDPSLITSAKIEGKVLDCSELFSNYSKLTTLDVSHFDTSNVTNMNSMFSGCLRLTTLDVAHFDTSEVTSMNRMFNNCPGLATIGKIDTASGWQHKPDDYDYMFYNCPATPKPSWYKE